jgi:DNA-binding PadR family transcriptional regulator
MQCSSPESFASVDHAQPAKIIGLCSAQHFAKITLYNFAAAHSLDTPIELTERLLLCILLANEDRLLSRTELNQITKINPSTIDSALLNLEQRNEVHTLPQHAPEQISYELTASGHTVAISLESWTTSFYQYAECGSDAGVRDLLHQLQRAIHSLIATKHNPNNSGMHCLRLLRA